MWYILRCSYVRCVAPGRGKQTDLHYDHVFFGTRLQRRETLLTCWLALTEISPVDGGLFVVENSHRFADCLSMIEGVEAVRVDGHPSNDPPWVSDKEYLEKVARLGTYLPPIILLCYTCRDI
jgi:ectoine hydroxylase-related dioxygenase (phytanoyl-CoA dioxygenase family)